MAIFSVSDSAAQALPMFREPVPDYISGRLLTDGRSDVVYAEGLDALAIWIRKALHFDSARFAYPAHTASYGNELSLLTGASRTVAESRLGGIIRSALEVNPYITGVYGFSFAYSKSGVTATFSVNSVYGDFIFTGEEVEL